MGKWLWGIPILAIISYLVGLFLFGGSGVNASSVGDSVRDALNKDHSWAKVEMVGNKATLSGEAPNQSAFDSAAALAKKTISSSSSGDSRHECNKCEAKAGEGFSVANNATVKQAAVVAAPKPKPVEAVSPYRFKATKLEDGRVNLEGWVPTNQDRQSVYRQAEATFGDRLNRKDVKIAAGAPDDNWDDVINVHLPELASLDTGTFTLTDDQAFLRGTVSNAGVRDNVNALATGLNGMYAGYNGAANITVPDAVAVNAGEVRNAELCQNLFNQLKGNTRINFQSAKAEIQGSQSFNLLNSLASAANQCKSYRIRVEGHTDSEGDAGYNQNLSEERARAVRAYLADNGVEVDRLTAVGFGETNPIATNDTREGKAANRRIEFVVTQSE